MECCPIGSGRLGPLRSTQTIRPCCQIQRAWDRRSGKKRAAACPGVRFVRAVSCCCSEVTFRPHEESCFVMPPERIDLLTWLELWGCGLCRLTSTRILGENNFCWKSPNYWTQIYSGQWQRKRLDLDWWVGCASPEREALTLPHYQKLYRKDFFRC